MSTPILDPSLPADHSPLSSGEMRGQFQAIQNNFDDLRARLIAVTPLGLTVSNPPTQADVQAIADKLDELLNTLNAEPRPGRDAFHRVPFFSGEVTDAVERVPTSGMFRLARTLARPVKVLETRSENQFSVTCAASSTSGRAKSESLSFHS